MYMLPSYKSLNYNREYIIKKKQSLNFYIISLIIFL